MTPENNQDKDQEMRDVFLGVFRMYREILNKANPIEIDPNEMIELPQTHSKLPHELREWMDKIREGFESRIDPELMEMMSEGAIYSVDGFKFMHKEHFGDESITTLKVDEPLLLNLLWSCVTTISGLKEIMESENYEKFEFVLKDTGRTKDGEIKKLKKALKVWDKEFNK